MEEELIKETFETTRKFGKWLAPFIGGTIEEAFGIVEDKLKYIRWSKQLDLIIKADKKLKELGLENKIKPLPLKIAIPLIEAATLEDEPYLKDMWVNLLINSSLENNEFTLERSYISVLEQISSFEAEILNVIYNGINSEASNIFSRPMLLTYYLPKAIVFTPEKDTLESKFENIEFQEPSDDVKLALSNLSRLQCIQLPVRRGAESYTHIYPTLFGKKLFEAVN